VKLRFRLKPATPDCKWRRLAANRLYGKTSSFPPRKIWQAFAKRGRADFTKIAHFPGAIVHQSLLTRIDRAAVRNPDRGVGAFPPTMPLGAFLFEYLYRCGVRYAFGIPGDFVLSTFGWLEKSRIQSVTMTHEPSAGFAADAYSRIDGLGLVCVTYCVGGLNVLNAIAGAYAEKSPVVVVSGAPGRKDREKDPLLHHKVKTFETQRRVYDEVTVASTVLLDQERAASEIVRCVEACLRHKRPVYIEVPHDMTGVEISTSDISLPPREQSDPATLCAALDETFALIRAARKPVILAGVELARYRMADLVLRTAERLNIPIAADLLSKSAVPETHPLYLGVYGGAMSSDERVREYVESADLVLMLGTFITDMSMGFYTAKLDRRRTVLATTERVAVQYHSYDSIQLRDFLEALAAANLKPKQFKHPNSNGLPKPLSKGERRERLKVTDVFRILSLHLDEHCCVVTDIGDAMFGAVGIRSERQAQFIGPAYYMSMGFAVPASIGIALAAKQLRPYVLVGDGAFQMTGTEISTAVRLGLNPVILVLNNDGYGTMRKIRDGNFNRITQWNYGKICELVGGGEGTTVSTRGELDAALRRARKSDVAQIIEVEISREDVSPQLARISLEVARRRGGMKLSSSEPAAKVRL
jgi:TPP-dependent 2-oxoacid decarboxylase